MQRYDLAQNNNNNVIIFLAMCSSNCRSRSGNMSDEADEARSGDEEQSGDEEPADGEDIAHSVCVSGVHPYA